MKDYKKECKINEEKLKTLSPTLRVKKRFIKVKFSGKKRKFEELSELVSEKVLFFMGAIDYSKSGFWNLKDQFDYEKQEMILRVGVEFKDKVTMSISMIDNVKVLRISGTLKGCNKEN